MRPLSLLSLVPALSLLVACTQAPLDANDPTGGAATDGTGGQGSGSNPPSSPAAVEDCVKQIAVTDSAVYIVRTDGSVLYSGNGGYLGPQVSTPTALPALTNVSRLAFADTYGGCAVTGAGILCWGINGYGEVGDGTTQTRKTPTPVIKVGGDVVDLAVGMFHACAVTKDGNLWCWGSNSFNQTSALGYSTMPPSTTGYDTFAQVSAGARFTCTRNAQGIVTCQGANDDAQLGRGYTSTAADYQDVSAKLDKLGKTLAVSAGGNHACALTSDGAVWCWGRNQEGQVGGGSSIRSESPLRLTTVPGPVSALSAGYRHTCAVGAEGKLYCWGDNEYGQLGDGTTERRPAPTYVAALGTGVVDVVAGSYGTCAKKDDGSVWCWGDNASGQIGDGTIGGTTCRDGDPDCKTIPTRISVACH